MKKLIKFYADWCGPCQTYATIWDEVTPDYKGQVEFVNIDVDNDTSGLAAKYKVRSIPFTVLIKEDGSEITKTGLLTKKELQELILS